MRTDDWVRQAAAEPPPAPADSTLLALASVMMVDDEPLMTDLIQAHLEDDGYHQFIACHDPREALDLMRTHAPGLVLLDLMMPLVDGFQVLAQMRADPVLRYTPVIVLTASNAPDSKLRALELGATDFLAKPVDASELVLRVRNTLAFKAYHERQLNEDAVSGLPNLRGARTRLEALLTGGGDGAVAVLDVAVTEAAQVRDAFGAPAADELVRALVERLRTVLAGQPQAQLLRLPDQGLGVVGPLPDAEAAGELARRIGLSLSQPLAVHGHEIVPTIVTGIALAPADGQDVATLVGHAGQARTRAQARGETHHAYFSPELNRRQVERLTIGAQLRRALERDEFVLHYQPKVSLQDGRIVGAEALIRWQHPEHGLLAPGRFIPLAEELGLIREIGFWVKHQACLDAAGWPAPPGGTAPKVSINVSRPQFERGRLIPHLEAALRDSGLAPSRLVAELTESMLVSDAPQAIALMHEVKALGVSLSIDDFGTGYSSLNYLKQFPLDELKVDRSFVMDLPGGRADCAIVQTVVALGHNLGMTVVAEGVETEAQRDVLKAYGCDVYQGFLYSKPVPLPTFVAMLG